MNNFRNSNNISKVGLPSATAVPEGLEINRVMQMVYLWMGLGLLTTAVVAFVVATNDSLAALAAQRGIWMMAIVAQFAIVLALSFGITRQWLTGNLAAAGFFVYAALTGFTLSLVFLYFVQNDPKALYSAFGTTAVLFGTMSMFGLTTKMDLTKWGSYLMMALIGLVIAMFVNILIGSGTLGFIISAFGVLLFTALTAYDTQKIKEMSYSLSLQGDSELTMKLSIIGALTLYLDFINLFLFLLQIFAGGSRR